MFIVCDTCTWIQLLYLQFSLKYLGLSPTSVCTSKISCKWS